MATTTNYSWSTPDDTALVKDGAAAIRTLGSSIDTTTKNLNPQTTTGALAYRSATSNVNTSLAIGTAGQLLRVNSGATAPEWATVTAGGLTVLASGSLSSTAVNITGIPATYKDLKLVVRNFDPTTDGKCNFRVQNDAGANRYTFENTNVNANLSMNKTFIGAEIDVDNGTTNGLIVLDFFDYANTTTWKTGRLYYLGSNTTTPANAAFATTFWVYNQTGAIDQVNILDGNATGFTGTYILYGVS
jgi:hypothetical protein